VVSEVLWSRGIRHLDAVALTHATPTTWEAARRPAHFHPTELWVGNNPRFAPTTTCSMKRPICTFRVAPFRAGDAFKLRRNQIAVLAPFPTTSRHAHPTTTRVLHMTNGATSVMLEGDASPVEQPC